jgi:acyl-CoA thioesterase FadM
LPDRQLHRHAFGVHALRVEPDQRAQALARVRAVETGLLLAGDIVEVTSTLLEVRDKSIRFLHEMRNAETSEVAATCEITGVHMDRKARKSAPFADVIRASAERHLEPAGA